MKIRNPLRGLMRSKSNPLDRWRPEPLARTTQKAMQILDAVNDTAGLPGAVVECGVGSGFSLAIFAMTLDGRRDGRALWAFDSFEGFPEGTVQLMQTLICWVNYRSYRRPISKIMLLILYDSG